jgi:hypothetical protein
MLRALRAVYVAAFAVVLVYGSPAETVFATVFYGLLYVSCRSTP